MFRITAFFVASAVIAAVSALPQGWTVLQDTLPSDIELKLSVALKPQNSDLLEKSLIEIATPGSARFRKYLKKSEITSIVGRSDDEMNHLSNFFHEKGAKVVSIPPHRDWMVISAPVSAVEKIFGCRLHAFVSPDTQRIKIGAADTYSVPSEISDLVELIAGMKTFPPKRWEATEVSPENVGAALTVTPQTIYDNYKSDFSGSHGSKKGSQAVVEFGALANFNEADTQTFFAKYQPSLVGETTGVVFGTNDGTARPSVEANLDVQYIMAAGVFVNTTDYKITGNALSIEDEFLSYTQLVNSQIEPPLVHSISYGEYGGSYDNATDQRFSYELQKMGIAGISVLLASGDNGVGCDSAGTTQEFDYPSSPYITMVGATYVDSVTNTEVGATLSSGGFSKDFWQAPWQADAVNAYFAGNPPMPHEAFFKDGRAYPDIAAYGQNVMVISSGKSTAVSGTSCSAPIFAGVVALLNHELLAKGEAPLGFLNPWLYANPQMFTDVTAGSNPYQKCDGFSAAAGWDPVTGLGTPIYEAMKAAAFAALKK